MCVRNELVAALWLLASLSGAALPLRDGRAIGAVYSVRPAQWSVVTNGIIWTNSAYNAFPFVAVWSNAYWCGFREGSDHVASLDGVGRLLSSADGATWTDRGRFPSPHGTWPDVREFMPLVLPDGRLSIRVRLYHPSASPTSTGHVYVTSNGSTWTSNGTSPQLLWQVAERGGAMYSCGSPAGGQLYSSADGLAWSGVSIPTNGVDTSESAAWFDSTDRLHILRRTEDGTTATLWADRHDLIVMDPPYTAAVSSARQYMGLPGGPWAAYIDAGLTVVGSRERATSAPCRPLLYSWRNGVLAPELALTTWGGRSETGYFSFVATNGGVSGVYYSDADLGKPCIYWFRATGIE